MDVVGFRSTRRTKIICTIGPGSSSPEILQTLAEQGMNVARLNMGHGTQDWHKTVIDRIRKLNLDKGYVESVLYCLQTQTQSCMKHILSVGATKAWEEAISAVAS